MKHIMKKRHIAQPTNGIATLLLLAGVLFVPAVPVLAQTEISCNSPSFFFIDSWSAYLCAQNGSVQIDNINDFAGLAFWAVDSILKLSAYIAAGFIIWGGIKYIKAQGDAGQISEAKNTITQALTGLVICIASVAIVQFVGGAF